MADDKVERPFIFRWRSAVLNSSMTSAGKLCHLALAEWADADGGSCYPSSEKVAELASLHERSVRRFLEHSDFIVRSDRGGQGQGWRAFSYQLVLPKAADTTPARSRKAADTTPARSEERSGQSVPKVRALDAEGAGTAPAELALELHKEQVRAKGRPLITFDGWAESLNDEASGGLDAKLKHYLDAVGVPAEYLGLFVQWAMQKWEGSAKKYRDWPSVITRALREDWHHLWRFGADGQCYLTTAGEQLRRLTEREAA